MEKQSINSNGATPGKVTIPLLTVTDRPDMDERGMWNVVERHRPARQDREGREPGEQTDVPDPLRGWGTDDRWVPHPLRSKGWEMALWSAGGGSP